MLFCSYSFMKFIVFQRSMEIVLSYFLLYSFHYFSAPNPEAQPAWKAPFDLADEKSTNSGCEQCAFQARLQRDVRRDLSAIENHPQYEIEVSELEALLPLKKEYWFHSIILQSFFSRSIAVGGVVRDELLSLPKCHNEPIYRMLQAYSRSCFSHYRCI